MEEISGGTLSAKLTVKGTQLNSVAVNNSGLIKRISGGEIYSENNGSGGTGNFATGIRNNKGGTITEISGGEIKGYVDNAAGSEVAYAVYNVGGATIGKISGGKLTGETSAKEWAFGIRNEGTITEISGGEIIALISQPTTTTAPNAIALCNDGTVSNVTGGTFYAYSACAPGNTIAIRTRQAGHSITISGGAYSVNKGTNHILNESPATTTYASGYALTAASKNGYRYAIPEGGRYKELSPQDSPVMTAKTYNASGVLLAEYTLTGTTTNEIAAIGDDIYGSVDAAIAASEAGDTVVLLKDTESGFTVPAGKEVTVDLNGYEIIGSVVNNGTLTLADTKGTGRLYKRTEASGLDPLIKNYGTLTYGNVSARIDGVGNGPEADGIYNNAGATLTVTGGTLRAISYGTKWSHAIVNGGTIKDFAGNFQSVSFSKDTGSNIVALSVIGGGIVEKISGGVLYAQSAGKGTAIGIRTQGTGAVQAITGGTVKAVVNGAGAKAYGVYTQGENGTVTVAGGLVSAVSYTGIAYALNNEGTANVAGGYFYAYTAADAACAAVLTSGTLNVAGGAFGTNKEEYISGTAAYEEGVALRKLNSDTVRYAAKETDVVVEQLDGAKFIGVDAFRSGNALYSYRAYEKDGYYLNGFYASGEDAEMIAKDKLNTLSASATVYAAYEEAPLYYFLGSSVTYGHANNGSSFVNEIANMLNCTCVKEAFSAARDAYRTDHPELFYIDFYKLTISAARANGVYTAYIDSGREANLYYDNGFNTPETVNTAINDFNAKINEIVAEMNRLEEADPYTERNAYLAKETGRYLAEAIEYDYVAYENKDDPNYIAAAYINTAYGGLVENKAVCGGYSTSYKVIMDKLGIPCITVNGYTNNKDENGKSSSTTVYHVWNYVYLNAPKKVAATADGAEDGAWYSVDVTWNSSAANKYRYTLMTDQVDEEIHVNDGVISSSGYKLTYPALSKVNYGSTGETDGLHTDIEYTPVGDKLDDYGNKLVNSYFTVSYNGKGAKRLLEEDNLYLAFRYAAFDKGQVIWNDWSSLEVYRQFEAKQEELTGMKGLLQDTGNQTRFYGNSMICYAQCAVFDVKPTRATPNSNPDATLGRNPETESYYFFCYDNNVLNDSDAIAMGDVIINRSYGTYTPPPYILSKGSEQMQIIRDSMGGADGFIAENKAFTYAIAYDEPLHKLDPNKPITVSFTSEHPNAQQYAKFYPVSKDDQGNDVYVELIEGATDPKKPEEKSLNTLRFKFAPSLMYEHNQEGYHFSFSNVGSAKEVQKKDASGNWITVTSDKAPNPAYYNFGRVTGVCPARFNYDGRLYIECCAQPTLMTQTDLSEDNFKDENGNSTFSANERSQMLLIAEKATDETVGTMLDEISGSNEISVNKEDIKTSETYDINLQICKKYPTIPDGSYIKMALGFPEGYGPDDEGVTFKLFHRKHIGGDEYIIEEVPCVVTKFGIVATVTSFSPYMVAVVDADKATDKNIYASIEGKGGTLTMEDGKIRTVKEGESYTYTVLPDKGYQLYSVTLNGEDVTGRVSEKGGKLTLTYDELQANNELEIKYIAEAAVARYADKSAEIVAPAKVVVSTEGSTSVVTKHMDNIVPKTVTADSSNTALVVGVSVGVAVIVVAAAVGVTVFMLKRKKKGANGEA